MLLSGKWEIYNCKPLTLRDPALELEVSWVLDAAMGSRLLCCVALCLLGAGPVDSGVTQTPKHLIKAKGQQMTLRCSPISTHLSVYWYQQALGQGPQFLIQYYDGEEREKGNISGRFSGQQFRDRSSELNVSILELTDSALYLCASSLAQPYMISSLQHKNFPAPAQEVNMRVVAARETGSGPQLSDRPSPDTFPASCMCAVFYAHRNHTTEVLLYRSCVWWEVSFPGLIFHNWQDKESNSSLCLNTCGPPPPELSPYVVSLF
nr:uncharacterized protein LOC106783094 [Equus caballus]